MARFVGRVGGFPSAIADTIIEGTCNNITPIPSAFPVTRCAARYDLTSARECDNVRLIRRQVWRAEALWSLGFKPVELAPWQVRRGGRCRALSADVH